ncbi:helix-turn-helix domain-containing protein [Haloactinospora alba]|uniref:helix-turn-helix domain-containing protein n=1 Tax=Haloactinospora alba TaxID=405555 RepID=UPI001B875B4E|nr:helix-turn-helix domain-containing protein [Haloactinospora alba]
MRAYQFALDPTPAQQQALASHYGAARFAYNWALARIKTNLEQRRAQRESGVGERELTPSVSWSAYGAAQSLQPGQG